ncbi:MAG TPA: histidine kinase [Gemmatimonadaceae bacterium]|nr:histidine kinase [Gemmatimonadaceae bacterium]
MSDTALPPETLALRAARRPRRPSAVAAALPFVAVAWLGIFFYAFVHWQVSERVGVPVPWFAPLFRSELGMVALWVAATPLILWSAARFPLAGERWLRHLALHAVLATIFIVASNAAGCAVRISMAASPAMSWPQCTERVLLFWFHYAFLTYFLIVALGQLGAWAAERRSHREHAAVMRAQLSAAQLHALQMQLQPHFLYNALNSATGLVLTNRNDEAVELLTGLGDLLRQLLTPNAPHETPLAEEMRFIQEYLGIERVRFSDRLEVACDAPDPALAAALVPRFILQPIVENAVRHGIAPLARGGRVEVTAERDGDRVRVTVRDDGVGTAESAARGTTRGHGTGLENTRRRLRHLYGDRARLTVSPRPGGGTEVVLEWPYRAAPDIAPAAAGAAAAAAESPALGSARRAS